MERIFRVFLVSVWSLCFFYSITQAQELYKINGPGSFEKLTSRTHQGLTPVIDDVATWIYPDYEPPQNSGGVGLLWIIPAGLALIAALYFVFKA